MIKPLNGERGGADPFPKPILLSPAWAVKNSIQSKLNFCNGFLKNRINNPLVYHVYVRARKHLVNSPLFAACQRKYHEIRDGNPVFSVSDSRSYQACNIAGRSEIIPMLRRNARASLPAQPAKAAVIILIDNGSSHLETLFQSLKSNTIYPNYQVSSFQVTD